MKLAEALIERAEIQKKNAQLISRIESNVKVQEGDSPSENPDELIAEYEKNMERLIALIQKINETNCKTPFDDKMNVAEAIVRRDCLKVKIRAFRNCYEHTMIVQERNSKSEIKFVRCIDAKALQNKIDKFSKEYREIDTKVQGINWTVELL